MNYRIEEVHISQVGHGDTILHDGVIKTLTSTYIKNCKFMGRSIWGDCYKLGYKKVKKVIILKAV